jgi:toxin ParE1/3/4
MRQVRLSPKARADLDSIWDYTATHRGSAQAEDYLRTLDETMKLIAATPYLGRNIDDIREGYFKFPAASHVLFYRIAPSTIEVIRILHKSMDVEGHL